MVKACPACGLHFEQDEGSRLGSAIVNYVVVAGVMMAYVLIAVVMTVPDIPVVPVIVGAGSLAIVVAVFFFPFGKTIWSAIEYVFRGDELT